MECNNNVTVSDSLVRLIEGRSSESQCLRLLARALRWQRTNWLPEGQLYPSGLQFKWLTSRLLNPELPGNYFTFREKEGMISFMPKGKEQQFNDDGTWKREGRQSVKPGKWIRSMLHPRALRFLKVKDHLFAEFNAIVRHEELRQRVTFREVPVSEAYNSSNFVDGIDSCMWGEPVGPFYDAFKCKAVVAVGADGAWRARAILWKNVKVGDGEYDQTFMDRIYADSEEVVLAMKENARDQGWWRKSCQDRSAGASISPDGVQDFVRLGVKTSRDLDQIDFYPYLDTFHSGGDSYLTNGNDGDYEYQNTDGTRGPDEPEDDHDGEVQDVDGEWIDEDYAVAIGDDYYHQDSDDIVYSDDRGEYYLRCECYRVKIGQDWQYIHRDNVEDLG